MEVALYNTTPADEILSHLWYILWCIYVVYIYKYTSKRKETNSFRFNMTSSARRKI